MAISSWNHEESFETCFDLTTHCTKGLSLFLRRCHDSGWVFEAPMNQMPRVRLPRARPLGPIAHRNHIVERLINKLIYTRGPLYRNIDAQLLHGRHSVGFRPTGYAPALIASSDLQPMVLLDLVCPVLVADYGGESGKFEATTGLVAISPDFVQSFPPNYIQRVKRDVHN